MTLLKFEVKDAQLCPTLCDPMDHTVHGILQATVFQWVAVPFSRVSFQPRDQTLVSRIAGGFFTNSTIRDSKLSLPINNFVLTFVVGMVICDLIKNDPHSLRDCCLKDMKYIACAALPRNAKRVPYTPLYDAK